MEIFFTADFFILGLIIGSFLNVVILRLNTGKSFGGRSECMACQNRLAWRELVPVLSFLSLRGRCRICQTKISIQYPLIELAAGLIFASLFLKFQNIFYEDFLMFGVVFGYYAVMFSLLLSIAMYDLRHKIIPDSLSFIFGALAFLGLFFFSSSGGGFHSFYFHLPLPLEFLSGLLIALPFALFWLVSGGRWMGLGDAKLALGIGWLLGFTLSFSALATAFWFGAIIGMALVVLSKKHKIGNMGMKSEIPFAPFLVFGAFLSFIFGLNLFGI